MDWNSPKDVLGLIPADDLAAMLDATYVPTVTHWSDAHPSVTKVPRQLHLIDPNDMVPQTRCAMGVAFERQFFLTAEQEEWDEGVRNLEIDGDLSEPTGNPGAEEVDEFLFHLGERHALALLDSSPNAIDVGSWFINGFDTCYYRDQTPRDFILWALQQTTCCDYVNQAMLDALREG